MKYSPDWVLSIVCSVITKRYVEANVPIQSFTNTFSASFETIYDDLTTSKLHAGVEAEMRFLAAFNDENPMKIVNAHIFNVITYSKPGKKRKLKGIFSNGISPKWTETSIAKNNKSFKVFFFQLRSDPSLKPEETWDLSQVEDIDTLIEILNKTIHVHDAL